MRISVEPISFCTSLLAVAVLAPSCAFGQQAPSEPPIVTLHAEAKLVVVDVVVQDKDRNPVHGLTADDFKLFEDGVPKKILSFDDHTMPPKSGPPLPKLPPGTFTNYTALPHANAINVLLLDSLNTPLVDQQFVRQELLDFLKKEPAGTPIAIFGLSTTLTMLQDFTSDPDVLKRVVLRSSGKTSLMLADPGGSQGPQQSFTDTFGEDAVTAHFQTFEDIANAQKTRARGLVTLNALNQLARYLSAIPGRKNLIWFSEAFPVDILPDASTGGTDPFEATVSMEDEYRETTDLLAASRVAVYPVDAGGLKGFSGYDATGGSFSSASFNKTQRAFSANQADVHYTMNRMAAETGGRATYNSNGLADAVSEAIHDGSAFYTLSYTPGNAAKKDDFHKLEVKLDKKGYYINFRRGVFTHDLTAVSPHAAPRSDSKPKPAQASSASGSVESPPAARPQPTSMERAMAFSSPDSTQMIFKFRVLPVTGKVEDKLALDNVANLKAKPPFVNYAVDYSGDPRSVLFTTTPDGIRHGSVNFVCLVYSRDGVLMNSVSDVTDVNLDKAMYEDMLRHGLHFHQEISVPVKGNYLLRIGLHDIGSDRIGTAAVAVNAVKNLTPLADRQKSAAASVSASRSGRQ